MTVPSATPFSTALTCQVCGSHDDSVRQVVYPYVFSFFVTFRREFHGRWCFKHRSIYLLLAAVITGTVGWLGFPFGLIFTPITLFRLAIGTVMYKAVNVTLLRKLAQAHEERGQNAGALRCLEASLQFTDDLWTRQELARFYTLPGSDTFSHFSPAWLFAGAVLISGLAGLASHYADTVWGLWPALFPISLAVIFVLRQIQEKVLESHPYRSPILIVGMALLTGIVAAYGFLEGRQIGNFLGILQNQPLLPSGLAFLNMLGAVLTRGGLLEISQELQTTEFWTLIPHNLLAVIPLIFPACLVLAARPYLAWEKLLSEIRPRPQGQSAAQPARNYGRVAPFAGFLCLSVLFLPFSQHSIIDFIEARDYLYAGTNLMDQGYYEEARAEFNTAVQLDQNYAQAYAEMGWAYYLLDDNQQAIAQYIRALELDPDRATTHYELSMVYSYDDQLEKAAQELETTLELDPAYSDAYLELGWVAYNLGDLDKAEFNFYKVIEFNDQEYDAYVGLGYIYEDRSQLDKAIVAYQQAVVSDPSYAEGHTLLGMALYDKNELDQAVTSLEKSVDLDPKNQMVRFYLTKSYIYTGLPDKAVEFSRVTVKLFPDWAGAHALLADALIHTRQKELAMAEIRTAEEITAKMDIDRSQIIQVLFDADLPAEAEKAAREAIKDGQRPSDFYLYLAESLSLQENYDQAFAACDEAEKAGIRKADILVKRAGIHLDQENYDLSVEESQQAIQLDPENADAHYMVSLAYSSQEDFAGALDEAQQAVALDRYFYGAYVRLAIAQLDMNNAQEAVRAASRAATLSPYADIPHYFLGLAYLQLGRDREAGIELNKFLDLYQGLPSEEGMKEGAEEILKRLNPNI